MKILVTGGAGYIGSHTCVELLEAGHEVVIADNLYNASRKAVDRIGEITGKTPIFYEADLCDRAAMEKIFSAHNFDAVIHFAGYKAVGESVVKPIEYYTNNLYGTLTLTDGYIASYNGETLPSTWISDRDAYAEGTAPTTGAQVVYKLATPQTIQLTANEIALIHGTNTFSTDADSITMRTVDPFRITNPTLMDAKPLIKINNGGSYYIDGELIIQTHGSGATYPMYIDSETMDAYAINEYGGKISVNGYVDLTAGFILIGKGTHELYSNNANNAWAIVPRWWRL